MGLVNKGIGFLTSEGHVVTAYHVVKNSCKVLCKTPSNDFISLQLVCYSEPYDISLLEPEIVWSEGINVGIGDLPLPKEESWYLRWDIHQVMKVQNLCLV